MYKSVALIPARSGSKRVKNKNILRINNHPLLAYAITNNATLANQYMTRADEILTQ